MKTQADILAAVGQRYGIKTSSDLAELLGISRQAVSFYKSNKRFMGAYPCKKISELLGMSFDEVVAIVEAERCKYQNEPQEQLDFWLKLVAKFTQEKELADRYKKMMSGILTVLISIGLMVAPAPKVEAKPVPDYLYYVNKLIRKARRYLSFRPVLANA